MSYGLTAQLLGDVSPLEKRVSRATLSQHVHQVARRTDGELGEEQFCFIEGRQAEWDQLLEPNGPLVVGIDGGYVHAREGENSKTASFEVIVGKSTTAEKQSKRFGFVDGYDTKSKHRVYEVLTS